MMAVELHRARELLLPSRFLADNNNNNEADNNILSNNNNNNSSTPNTDFNVPNNNNGLPQPPFGSSSDSSSSELASFTETETDDEEEDDDYIAELTRQMAHYMFQDDDNLNSHKIDKSWGLDGCPHSSLLCSPNHGIPKWDPGEPSPPPTTPEILKQRTNSACEIMGTLEQLKISNEVSKIPQPPPPQEQFQSMLQNPSSTPISVDNPSVGFCSNQALLHQIRAIQFYRLKQEQLLKQQTKEPQHHPQFQKKNRGYANGSVNGVGSRPTPWVNQQQKNGSGMRAIFLGGSSSTSNGGSGGTGVFLPCVIGNTTTTNQSRKKRGCSPVLIPAKVVQALRVHFDRMGYNISDLPEASTFPLQHDSYKSSGGRSSEKCPEKKRHSRAVQAMKRNEMGLPQEWTY